MYKSLHARLEIVAEEDNDREVNLRSRCPTRLSILLVGQTDFLHFELIDGLNSLDDDTIDVLLCDEDDPEKGTCWVIALQHIAAVRLRYPLQSEMDAARC